jgi:hypothetical protein
MGEESLTSKPKKFETRYLVSCKEPVIAQPLLREKQLNPVYAEQLAGMGVGSPQVLALAEKLLAAGPDKLTPAERLLIMADERTMVWLYHEAWLRQSLAPWWKASIRGYSRQDES